MANIVDPHNPLIVGTEQDDFIKSLKGDDTIFAGGGNDRVEGGDDNDSLFGEAGNDTLDGGSGDDILVGGTGNDLLIGGSGADTFVFDQADGPTGNDIITDFEAGIDTLDLTGTNIIAADFANPDIFSHDAGAGTLTIDLGNGNSVVLQGIDAAEFAAIADSIVFDTCKDITATEAAETFALPVDGCVTITGFELGETNLDMLDLTAFGITPGGLDLLEFALFGGEGDLLQFDYFIPPNDILHWIEFNMRFNGFPNDDGILDNNDIEVLRQISLDTQNGTYPFGIFDSQEEVDAFNQIIDAYLTYDFEVTSPIDENGFPIESGDFEMIITRDADGSEAGHLTLIGISGGGILDLFENHLTG